MLYAVYSILIQYTQTTNTHSRFFLNPLRRGLLHVKCTNRLIEDTKLQTKGTKLLLLVESACAVCVLLFFWN